MAEQWAPLPSNGRAMGAIAYAMGSNGRAMAAIA